MELLPVIEVAVRGLGDCSVACQDTGIRRARRNKGQGAGRSWGEPRETAAPGRDFDCNILTYKNKRFHERSGHIRLSLGEVDTSDRKLLRG